MKAKKLIKLILPSIMVAALALVAVMPAFAAVDYYAHAEVGPNCEYAFAVSEGINTNGTVEIVSEASVGGLAYATGKGSSTNGSAGTYSDTDAGPFADADAYGDSNYTLTATYGGPATGHCFAIALVYIDGELVYCAAAGDISCPGAGYNPPAPPGIWAADVCEPFDGFSGDGWTTFGSDANDKPYGSTLYVAAGPDGPWFETGFLQSPYVISQSQMDALTVMVGLTDYHGLWMRPGDVGIAANVGSMYTDREGKLDALCGN